jgi:hypothetical protein
MNFVKNPGNITERGIHFKHVPSIQYSEGGAVILKFFEKPNRSFISGKELES